MKKHYFFMGEFGYRNDTKNITSKWSNLVTVEFDGTPQGEAIALQNALNHIESQAISQVSLDSPFGVDPVICGWMYRSLIPLGG